MKLYYARRARGEDKVTIQVDEEASKILLEALYWHIPDHSDDAVADRLRELIEADLKRCQDA